MPPSLVVQKFGGSSLADADRIRRVARRIARERASGADLVVVVSAMGDTTDELIGLAAAITDDPDPRELDLLLATGEHQSATLVSMALHALGVPAISLTGPQAGITTDGRYGKARIAGIEPSRVRAELAAGKVVIVAGFQGMSVAPLDGATDGWPEGASEGAATSPTGAHPGTPPAGVLPARATVQAAEITTLGRGGSDTTAVALAARLRADRCQIFTDVRGIYTADPRIVPEARQLPVIGYEEMLELAHQGAQVMQTRAVELGWVNGVVIEVLSSFEDAPGTLIKEDPLVEQRNKVRGLAHDRNVAKITLVEVPDRPGVAAAVFEPLAEAGISVDMIVQNVGHHGATDLSFTIARPDLARAKRILEPLVRELGFREMTTDSSVAKVSIVGAGIQNAPGYAARMFRALADNGINIEMISTSEIRITCMIAEDHVEAAVRALHRAFELEKPEPEAEPVDADETGRPTGAGRATTTGTREAVRGHRTQGAADRAQAAADRTPGSGTADRTPGSGTADRAGAAARTARADGTAAATAEADGTGAPVGSAGA
ncbi:MAG TPA: aspartate kinase [Candidatus Limnocylindrales bacterium]|nr:aspartate kinase [Candidatus Limnocylindrales bacterium]